MRLGPGQAHHPLRHALDQVPHLSPPAPVRPRPRKVFEPPTIEDVAEGVHNILIVGPQFQAELRLQAAEGLDEGLQLCLCHGVLLAA